MKTHILCSITLFSSEYRAVPEITWKSTVWCGVVRMVWYGRVWCGMVEYGVVW